MQSLIGKLKEKIMKYEQKEHGRREEERQDSSRMWPRQSFAARSEQCVEVSFSGSVVANRG